MGGIKNKQSNKLSNKTVTKGSRLPSFSQPSEMLTRNISNTRTSSWWSLYASKTIGSLRLVTLTKYLSITCLSLVLISTIGLNIISSYSSSNILSNAEEVATLATGPVVSGPAEIAISIQSLTTPTSSPCDTSNSDICMSIPDDGGIATGGHTVSIDSSSVAGWTLSLSNNSDSKLINKDNSNNIDNGTATIDSLPITANLQSPTRLANNTWGIALPYGTNAPYYSDEANYTSSDKDVLANNLYSSIAYFNQSSSYYIAETVNPSTPGVESRNIYYGVRVDHPEQLLAGNYTTKVVYTATTKPVPAPTITSITPSSYQLGSGGTNTVTIEGTNLSSAYRVYLVSNTGSSKQYDITNTITNLTNTGLTVTIPTDQTNPELEAGEYTIHVVTQGTDENGVTAGFTYTDIKRPTFGYITTMQEMTPEICANAAENETARLIDERDGKLYWVAKLADGNCWMTQNLDLDLQSGTALTPDNSDVSSNWDPGRTTFTSASRRASTSSQYKYIVQSWDLGNAVMKNPLDAGRNSGNCSTRTNLYDSACSSYWANVSGPGWTAMDTIDTDSNPIDETNHTYDAHYLAGNYYSWQAATAGTGSNTADGNAATSSICPRGWKLPQLNDLSGTSFNNVDGSFNKLLTSYDLTVLPWEPLGNDPVETAYFVAPLYLVRAGYLYWDGSTLDAAGRYGSYSTATAYVSVRGLLSLMVLRNEMISSTLAGNSLIGRSVRCVATAS